MMTDSRAHTKVGFDLLFNYNGFLKGVFDIEDYRKKLIQFSALNYYTNKLGE